MSDPSPELQMQKPLRAEATEVIVNTTVPHRTPGDSSPPVPEQRREWKREWKPRDIALLRKTLSMLCNYVWTKQLREGEHLWTIPVDKERDFDCILSDAISELEELRAVPPRTPGAASPPQPIFTQPNSPDGTTLMIAVFREDDGRFAAEWSAGGEVGMGEYSSTPIGALANVICVLLKVEEDRVLDGERLRHAGAIEGRRAPAPEK